MGFPDDPYLSLLMGTFSPVPSPDYYRFLSLTFIESITVLE